MRRSQRWCGAVFAAALLMAATAAVGDPETESSGLWWSGAPAPGQLNADRVHAFDGLKAEGLALSPTPGRLIVAFDTGAQVPLWTELSWPTP